MSISIIIPIYNINKPPFTLRKTLESLLSQDYHFDELILIDDASKDNSFEVITDFIEKNKGRLKNIKTVIYKNKKNMGLAYGYNKGIKLSHSDLLVFMHQDVIAKKDALRRLVEPFSHDLGIVATYSRSFQSYEVWSTYDFWQKYFFCRWVGKTISGMNGKFDCMKKSALLKVGCYDWKTFRVAGEDGDIILKLKKIGKIVPTEAKILHSHDLSPNSGIQQLIKKQAQLSESQGALYRKYGMFSGFKGFITAFFREAILIMLFIPYLRLLSLVLMFIYSIMISKVMYLREYKNPRIFIVPFLNLLMIPVSAYSSIRGFITGKQTL